jgi:16S rRNA (guanine966-N2)-methyltransferase
VATSKRKNQPGRLRIVAGKWRSRLLEIATAPGLRPTSERVRETLFNWLAPSIQGARCLDLFAGTGALGLEALSRGAAETVFVEKSAVAVKTLRDNVATLNASTAVVRNTDAFRFLSGTPPGKFDIVFLDPPFGADILGDLCRVLSEASILKAKAQIYIEEQRDSPAVELPADWEVVKSKLAGNVRYSLLRVGDQEQGG